MGWQKPRGTLSPCVIAMARLGELDCDRLREGALRYLAEMKETATQPGHDQPGWQTVLVDVSVDALRNRPTTTDVKRIEEHIDPTIT